MSSDDTRIVITGIGVVSPIGIGKEAFWQGLKEGRSGIKPVTLFDTSTTHSKLAGEITDFKPEEILGPKGLRNLDRTTKLALCAAKLCLDDANFQITAENTSDVGVVLGSTMGSVWSISEYDKQALKEGPRSVNPALFANTVINSPASQISIRFGVRGFNTTISTGFSSALDALKYASDFIKWGKAKAVLVGSAEELCEQFFKGFYKLGVLSKPQDGNQEMLCPFDKRRNGMILGEGAAVFLLESLPHARQRNANIYAEIKAIASSFDKRSMNRYNLKATGEIESMEKTLSLAKLDAKDIDCVVASANSTVKGDQAESTAITQVFDGNKPSVTACKSMFGETFSVAGAMNLAAGIFILKDQFIPATLNLKQKDSQCDVECVNNAGTSKKVNHVLINSFGASGQNSSLVLMRDN